MLIVCHKKVAWYSGYIGGCKAWRTYNWWLDAMWFVFKIDNFNGFASSTMESFQCINLLYLSLTEFFQKIKISKFFDLSLFIFNILLIFPRQFLRGFFSIWNLPYWLNVYLITYWLPYWLSFFRKVTMA